MNVGHAFIVVRRTPCLRRGALVARVGKDDAEARPLNQNFGDSRGRACGNHSVQALMKAQISTKGLSEEHLSCVQAEPKDEEGLEKENNEHEAQPES